MVEGDTTVVHHEGGDESGAVETALDAAVDHAETIGEHGARIAALEEKWETDLPQKINDAIEGVRSDLKTAISDSAQVAQGTANAAVETAEQIRDETIEAVNDAIEETRETADETINDAGSVAEAPAEVVQKPDSFLTRFVRTIF